MGGSEKRLRFLVALLVALCTVIWCVSVRGPAPRICCKPFAMNMYAIWCEPV
jgi:hypothetical protein